MRYLDFFDEVYYINLDSRSDRRELFEKRAAEQGIEAIRFSAITPDDYTGFPGDEDDERRRFKYGCSLSHIAIYKEVKQKGLTNVLIFEDDCVFEDNFKDRLQASIDDLKNIKWDMFYLGGDVTDYCDPITNTLNSVKKGSVYCTHAYAINNSFFDRVSSLDPIRGIIDILLLHENHSGAEYVITKDILALQDTTYSDLWGHMTSSSEWMKEKWQKHTGNEKN